MKILKISYFRLKISRYYMIYIYISLSLIFSCQPCIPKHHFICWWHGRSLSGARAGGGYAPPWAKIIFIFDFYNEIEAIKTRTSMSLDNRRQIYWPPRYLGRGCTLSVHSTLCLKTTLLFSDVKFRHKKLSCRSETARRFVSLNILLSNSRSFKMTLLRRACVSP